MRWRDDLRYVAFRLWRARGYSATVAALLAGALVASAVGGGLLYSVVLRPTPVASPDELVIVWETDPQRSTPIVELPYRLVEHWRRESSQFSQVAAMGSSLWPATLTGRDTPVRVGLAGVTGTFFATLGTTPHLGRTIDVRDDIEHAPEVAVLSHAAWVRLFGAREGVVGETVHLDRPREVVGVMPRDVDIPRGVDVWVPVTSVLRGVAGQGFDPFTHVGVLYAIGRLRPQATLEAASVELDALAAVPVAEGAPFRFGQRVEVTPYRTYELGAALSGLWAVGLAGVGLLVIAGVNVWGLMQARAAHMRPGHAIRLALGASPGHVRRLWLLETAVLTGFAMIVGLAAVRPIWQVLLHLVPDEIPRLDAARLDLLVLAAAALSMAAVAACAGSSTTTPASARHALRQGEYARTTTPGRRRQSSLRLVVQMAVTVALMLAAGLVVRSVAAMRALDVGFAVDDTITMHVGAASNAWMAELLERVRAHPDVTAAGALYLRPLELGAIGQEAGVLLRGQADAPDVRRANPTVNLQIATPGLQPAMGLTLRDGRWFDETDRADAPLVAVIGASTARRLWPDGSALGQDMQLPGLGDAPVWRTVVGIVDDVHFRGLGDVRLDTYLPAAQADAVASFVAVRTRTDAWSAVTLVRTTASALDRTVTVDAVMPLRQIVDRAVAPRRFALWILVGLAGYGLVLAVAGLFAQVVLDGHARRRELAVRTVVGATRGRLIAHVSGPLLRRSLAGIVLGGLVFALVAGRFEALLFGITPHDGVTWAAVACVMLAGVGLAALVPAVRASRVQPAELLRQE